MISVSPGRHAVLTWRRANVLVNCQCCFFQHHRRLGGNALSYRPANNACVVCPVTDAISHGQRYLLLLYGDWLAVGFEFTSEHTSFAPSCMFKTVSAALMYSATLCRSVTRTYSPWIVAMRKSPFFDFLWLSRTKSTGFCMNLIAAIHGPTKGMGRNPRDSTLG